MLTETTYILIFENKKICVMCSLKRFHSRKKTGKDTKLGSGLCEDIGQSGAAPTHLSFTLTISMKTVLQRIRESLPNLE